MGDQKLAKPRKALFPGEPKPREVAPRTPLKHPFAEGDYVIDGDGSIKRVRRVTKKSYSLEYKGDDGEWHHWGETTWEEHERRGKWMKMEKTLEEYQKDLLQEMASGFAGFEGAAGSTSTDVMVAGGKDQATAAKAVIEQTNHKLAILTAIMERQRRHLRHIQNEFEQKLEAISRVIDIIELYLGVYEQIVQIVEGEPAPSTDPICFRQLVLHMDEEVADTSTGRGDREGATGGIDFRRIKEFDAWIREHYEQVLPESKGVVIIRPRRDEKDYRLGEDLFAQSAEDDMNRENFKTYILIRNGDNLYRIRSETVEIYPWLFPSPEEMQYLATGKEDETKEWHQQRRMSDRDREAAVLAYKRNVLMLQGLMDRTDVFKPCPTGLNLLNPESYGDAVKFIYDGSSLLGTGRPEFFDWLKQLNSKMKRGHRLYFAGFPYGEWGPEKFCELRAARFPIPGWDARPAKGVYNVVRTEICQRRHYEDTQSFICHHNPKDEIYKDEGWGRRDWESKHERKMSMPFRLFPSDRYIINYEDVDPADVDFYLHDRVNRQHYLRMMPVLRGVLRMKAEEKVWEDNFVTFMAGRFKRRDDVEFEKLVREGIVWWKTKVIDKRPLKKEDAKAVAMIEGFVKRALRKGKGGI